MSITAKGKEREGQQSSQSWSSTRAGSWAALKPKLPEWVVNHLEQTLAFTLLTPVQASTIPPFCSHKDVIVEALTGSGKTLAYIIPIVHMLEQREDRLNKHQLGALIITPTRELAVQVHSVLQGILEAQPGYRQVGQEDESTPPQQDIPPPRIAGAQLVVGGSALSPAQDLAYFKDNGPDIIVGTPGRIEELLQRSAVKTNDLSVLVLDEADRLLDLGFVNSLRTIMSLLPKQRRTGLFSATMTDALTELVRMGLRNPVRVLVKVEAKMGAKLEKVEDRRTPASLQNFQLACRPEHKLAQLVRVLQYEAAGAGTGTGITTGAEARKFIVYFATCAQVNYFYKIFTKLPALQGLVLHSLHGKQTPSRRTAAYNAFVSSIGGRGASGSSSRTGASVLLCTDVAARGLDLPDVDVVVQFDAPTDPKVFSHRCGRTARAGRKGRAVLLLSKGREEEYVEFLQVRQIPLKPYPYLSASPSPSTEPPTMDASATSLESTIRTLSLADRELWDLSVRAFVSYVRAYAQHDAGYIFSLRQLDVRALARAYGMLRVPKMPELATCKGAGEGEGAGFEEVGNLDFRTFAYADKAREAQRLSALAKMDAEKERAAQEGRDLAEEKRKKRKALGEEKEEAWSVQKKRKETRDLRRVKKLRKREWVAKSKELAVEGAGGDGEDRSDDDALADWIEEEREAKRARRARRSGKGAEVDKEGAEGQEALDLEVEETVDGEEGGGFFDGM